MSGADSCDGRPGRKGAYPWRSFLSTLMLIPFLLVPYRWLGLPCGLAAALIACSDRDSFRSTIRRDGTLILGSTLVLIVRTLLDPLWWLPWAAFMLLVSWLIRRPWWKKKWAVASACTAMLISVLLLWRPDIDSFAAAGGGNVDPDTVVVCAGDSLTSGVAYKSDAGTYVAHLRRQLGCTVINAGVASDRAGDLLKRLDKDVISKRPAVVLLFIGGNDYLDGVPRGVFASNLEAIVSRLAARGAHLVIVEVPTGIIWNPYAGVYRHLAARYDAILVPESRLRAWYSVELLLRDHLAEPLTIDGIHLSPAGAARVADWLMPYVNRALHTQSGG